MDINKFSLIAEEMKKLKNLSDNLETAIAVSKQCSQDSQSELDVSKFVEFRRLLKDTRSGMEEVIKISKLLCLIKLSWR